ncbi:3'(2'),5'-bisphosphate nucleotidase CysQ [Caminicella sporogenes]|uniref:3'(2'),5'-bisphosphate nucleotidase CysQ n=1 Tax=Caminicella sporogenes TaxID=166485 RepID=UPI00253F8262|nr:3'(2'),5'-bisphosphate nucleotidase CysQ [Caminicella sporogenes]WIF95353.1 3'(2'),5'-bisphosphate nucleotidase CysQ [Caminicella sporogenes]
MNLIKELDTAKKLAVKAGKAILDIYENSFEIEYKEDKSPITLADKKSNDVIVEGLKKEFPAYSILSEELEDNKARLKNDWCWIVDPLDGTKEFIKKNGEFTVNIALSYKNKVVLGVIYIPVTDELYYGIKGVGAFYKNKYKEEKIKVSDRRKELRVVMSRSHATNKLTYLLEKNKDKISDVKKVGSSLKGCLIARGEAEIYYRFSLTKEWDTAAMQAIVECAGGIFKQIDGSDMIYNRENPLNEKGFYILNNIDNKLT